MWPSWGPHDGVFCRQNFHCLSYTYSILFWSFSFLPGSTKGRMWRTILIPYGVLTTTTLMTHALFLSWDKNANLTEDDIFINRRTMVVPNVFGRVTPAFRNLTSYSLDERCKRGMPLSISWSLNEPYSGILGPTKMGKSYGFAARGIFPCKYIIQTSASDWMFLMQWLTDKISVSTFWP